jgi:hypothetical protein
MLRLYKEASIGAKNVIFPWLYREFGSLREFSQKKQERRTCQSLQRIDGADGATGADTIEGSGSAHASFMESA